MRCWHEDPDELGRGDVFDPLCVERSAPVEDEEAAMVEALCLDATPGPLVIDDEVEGEGAVVASLPDGRLIVSLTAPVEQANGRELSEANARLICKARFYLLRLLRDRQRWQQQRAALLERIRTLEAAVGRQGDAAEEGPWAPISRPR